MTEITTSTNNTNANATTTTATTTTTTIIPPSIPPDNGSEYQRSYSWKLPMVKINKPAERKKSEYQREFTWKNDPPSTPSPAPSPAPPIAPSPIPQDFSNTPGNSTPEPIKPSITSTTIDSIGSKLNDLSLNNEPANIVMEKFSSNNNVSDKWKDGLRNKNSESRQSLLASSLDPKTKKIVALEANRLSKKSRSYSMYSLHDALKVAETADELSNHYESEYNREFVNWKQYGTAVREDTMANKNRQANDRTLRRRGSWSSPDVSTSSLPAPLKWLEDLNIDFGSRVNTREKLQPTITDSKSIRGISTKSQSRSNHDHDYYDEKRPKTSADFHYDRPTTSADIRNYSRPMTSLNNYDNDDDYYYNSKRNSNLDHPSSSKKDRNDHLLRSSTTLGHYKDYDYNGSNGRTHDYDYFNDKKYDDRKRDSIYDDYHKDSNVYDDRRRDSNIYDDRRRDVYDDRRKDNNDIYDDRRKNNYDDRRKDNNIYDDDRRRNNNDIYDDRRRDSNSFYDDRHDRHDRNDRTDRHDKHDKYDRNDRHDYDGEYDSKYKTDKHFNPGHSRNTSYASSNKSFGRDEPINPYIDAMRHRSSVSSLSSISTPSMPATPTGYENDSRWRRNNGLDPRIYKEQYYTPSITSKSSSSSNHKYWQFEDEKDKYYSQNPLSPSRSKFYVEDEDEDVDDHHHGAYSSKHHSRDYKPSSMRYSSQSSPMQTRSSSPSYDGYDRRYYHKSSNYSRPASRATSVSSHATSIEEESAKLTDLLKDAELLTLKNISDQKSVFKLRDLDELIPTGRSTPSVASRAPSVAGRATPSVSGRATPSVKRTSLSGQKKSTTTTTTANKTKTGVKTSKTTPQTTKTTTRTTTKTSTKTGVPATKGTKGSTLLDKKKGTYRPGSSLSTISTSSYREAFQPPPSTNFSAAREALNKARMKVEEMLEIVSNGGSLD